MLKTSRGGRFGYAQEPPVEVSEGFEEGAAPFKGKCKGLGKKAPCTFL
jgi:hypothetical protein